MSTILIARENKKQIIMSLTSKLQTPIISIKANIPGPKKNIPEAYVIIKCIYHFISKQLNIKDHFQYDSDDGPFILISLDYINLKALKQELIEIETNHPLGRFVDLDLFHKTYDSMSRSVLNIPPRKCYLCDLDAAICSRNQNHHMTDLLDYIRLGVSTYLSDTIIKISKESMLRELNLEHKFGLVTPLSKGSHPDMDYNLMKKAMDAITPFFGQMIIQSFKNINLDQLFESSRIIGLIAEKKMLEVTQGINCYKGLIFNLGFVIISLGYTLYNQMTFTDIFHNIKVMSSHLIDELGKSNQTFGQTAYINYDILGARGEAINGMPFAHYGFQYLSNQESLTDMTLRKLLKDLVVKIDDTVLLKRSNSYQFYLHVKEMFNKAPMETTEDAEKLTEFCTSNHLSVGGSADILVTSLCLLEIKSLFF